MVMFKDPINGVWYDRAPSDVAQVAATDLAATNANVATNTSDVTALKGVSAKLQNRAPGALWVSLGDSTVAGSDDPTNQAQGMSWPVLAGIITGQRLKYVHNAGIGGNTTAQMLARFTTDVAAYNPTVVTIGAGTNDVGQDVPLATTQANLISLVTQIRGIGATPVMQTINPRASGQTPSDMRQRTMALNTWIRSYAQANGIHLLDFYGVLTDPATGGFKAATPSTDGVHTGALGWIAQANYVNTQLASLLPLSSVALCQTDADETSTVRGGCFTAGAGTAYTAGWVDGAGQPSGSALSYVTDSQVPGQMLTMTQTAASGVRQAVYAQIIGPTTVSTAAAAGATTLVLAGRGDPTGPLYVGSGSTFEVVSGASVSGFGPQTVTLNRPLRYAHAVGEPVVAAAAVGDSVIFSGRVTSDGGVPVNVKAEFAGGTPGTALPMSSITAPITRGVFHGRFVVPPGTTQINVSLQAGAGTGVVSFGQIGLYNATRLGI